MMITNKFTLDLQTPGTVPTIHAVQNDTYSRNLEITLYADRLPFIFPETGRVVIRYKKSDGKGGEYDTLPDGRRAWQADQNILAIALAPQVLTTPGSVSVTVTLINGETQLSVFSIRLAVEPIAAANQAASEDYFYITGLLPAPVSGNVGQSLRISAINSEGRITAVEAADKVAPQKGIDYWTNEDKESIVQDILKELNMSAFDPAVYGLPVLYLSGDTTDMSKENAVSLNYAYGKRNGECTLKWQGSSSLYYPKKNYTIKFDNAFEAVEGWNAQQKYCLKANWIDHSHARNVVSAKLWGEVVKSRASVNTKLSALPNGGAVDGFPCIVMLNDDFHGLYTFNIPKDGWMYDMKNDGNQTSVTETFGFGTWITADGVNGATAEYTPTSTITGYWVSERSPVLGGRAYFTWDNQKIGVFGVRAYIFDTDGNYVKAFGYTSMYDGVVGDLPENALVEPGNVLYAWENASFSIPVPDGYSVMWEGWHTSGSSLPDGTLTHTWSGEAEANNTWSYTWLTTGIEYSIVSASGKKEAIFSAEGNSEPTKFQAEAKLDGTDFELEYVSDENNSGWALTSLNRLITACINSDGTDLDSRIAGYLDWDSAIDYYIYACLIGGADIATKNYLLSTYDGTKWFFGAYDLDSTFGLWWDGTKLLPDSYYPTIGWYGVVHKAMELILNYKKDQLKARYAELRAGALSENNVALAFSNFISKISSTVYAEDAKKWPTIPSTSVSNLNQILNWYRLRVANIDREMESL